MKKTFTILVALLCTGCTSLSTYKQMAETSVKDLQEANDPIQVIESYKEFSSNFNEGKSCESRHRDECFDDGDVGICIVGTILIPLYIPKLISVKSTNMNDYYCFKRDSLLESNVKLECTITEGYNNDKYSNNSDDCILYRRSENYHKSKINYFDYKRFFNKKGMIQTEDDFLNLVKIYDSIQDCDKLQEKTTEEKNNCKEKIKEKIRSIATRKVSCTELINEKYIKYLKDKVEWFYWAQHHDPKEKIKQYQKLGVCDWNCDWAYQPVFSYSEAYHFPLFPI
ncbi:MAG: hypothetical protein MJ158_02500 [Alphaproteobacteria bacterium]|nr:hypothetical protein [Alphaproteobacteria bacterium]